MTRAELLALPHRPWNAASVYDTLLLIPTGHKHESGFVQMALIGVNDRQAVEIAASCPDDINWHIPAPLYDFLAQVRTDCLWKSKASPLLVRPAPLSGRLRPLVLARPRPPSPSPPMTIDACVAHAIHLDLDIIKEFPQCTELPPGRMEAEIERFVVETQDAFTKAVERNLTLVQRKDAQGLASALKRRRNPAYG